MATLVRIEVPQGSYHVVPGSSRATTLYESTIVVPKSRVKADSAFEAYGKSLLAIFAVLIAVITVIALRIRQAREIGGAVIRHPITDRVWLVFHPEPIAGASKQVTETTWSKFIRCTALILSQ